MSFTSGRSKHQAPPSSAMQFQQRASLTSSWISSDTQRSQRRHHFEQSANPNHIVALAGIMPTTYSQTDSDRDSLRSEFAEPVKPTNQSSRRYKISKGPVAADDPKGQRLHPILVDDEGPTDQDMERSLMTNELNELSQNLMFVDDETPIDLDEYITATDDDPNRQPLIRPILAYDKGSDDQDRELLATLEDVADPDLVPKPDAHDALSRRLLEIDELPDSVDDDENMGLMSHNIEDVTDAQLDAEWGTEVATPDSSGQRLDRTPGPEGKRKRWVSSLKSN